MRVRLDRISSRDELVLTPGRTPQTRPIHDVERLPGGRVRVLFGAGPQVLEAPGDHLVTVQRAEVAR